MIVRSIMRPINAAITVADQISHGKYVEKNEIRGFLEAEKLGLAFARMSEQVESQIQQRTNQLEQQNWLKSHGAELSENISMQDTLENLADYVIITLAETLSVHSAVFYIRNQAFEEDAELELILFATYGYKKRKSINTSFKLGEGLVGQCAKEKKVIILTNLPEDYILISSGLGEKTPKNLYIMPVL